jgi:hypothetical protein
VLWLHRNGLAGRFPASLSNITALAVISRAYNNLVGNVPDEFAKLSGIQQLYLGANQLGQVSTGRHESFCLN